MEVFVKMNKTIKKIAALSMGATMLAGTAAMALATDLSNYPAPFVKDGVFVGKIVIGEKAAAIDTVGALDIAASLQRSATTKVASSGSSTSVEGGFRLDTTGDRIYFNEAISVDSVSKDNLALLADGQFEDDEGTVYDYTQSVVFSKSQNLTFGQHGDSDVDSYLAFDLSTSASSQFYTTKIDFTKTLNTTNDNVIGNKITLFGNEYTFSSESTSDKVVLYGSAEEVSLTTKDEVTKTVEGKEYKVKVIGFSSTGSKVTLQVNGATDSISEGSTKTIGGLKVYVKSVSSWNNGIDGFSTLQLGANKVVLQDGQAVQVGTSESDVDGTQVDIGGTATALTYIYVKAFASDSDFDVLKAGGDFVDPTWGTFKITFPDSTFALTADSRDAIEVSESGSSRVIAKLPIIGGTTKTVYFNYGGALKWDSSYTIYPVEGAAAAEDSYVYLAPGDSKYTHLVKVQNIKTHATEGYVEFEDALTGADYKTDQGNFNDTNENLTLTVEGKSYRVNLVNDATPTVAVWYDSDSKLVVFPEIELRNGETFFLTTNLSIAGANMPTVANNTAIVFPGGSTGISGNATVTTGSELSYNISLGVNINGIVPTTYGNIPTIHFKEERDYGSSYEIISVPTAASATTTNLGTPSFTAVKTSGSMEDDYTTAYVDYYGTYVTSTTGGSGDNNNVVKVYYPNDQVYANVFVSPLAAKATSTSTSGAVALNPISVGLAILDSEASLGSKPYIVVGGPCANTVAAELLGNKANCAEGFTEGKAMIKLFSEKNALLVAGYSGKDTQGACRVLAAYTDYDFAGTELEVVTANMDSLSVKKVSN
jgi:hypothetical protein